MNNAQRLQQRIDQDEILIAPGASDAITARLVQAAGFEAIYMTGFGATASRLGTPDIGLLTQTEMTEHARNMVRAVTIPVIADADTGYGGPSNIWRTVREHVQAGSAAIHLEDQVAPKRCGQLAGIRLIDAVEAAKHLECAVKARGDDDLLIIGRTDALGVMGIDEAVDRAHRYQDAGIDIAFIDGVRKAADVEEYAKRVEGPKIISLVEGNDTDRFTATDLQQLGFSVVLWSMTALFTATKAISSALAHMRQAGTPVGGPAQHTYAEYCELVDLAFHQDLDHTYGN